MNWLGLLVSYAFVFGLIGLATILMKRKTLEPGAARKLIHIGVSNWWLIAMATFDNPLFASVGPLSFILINALALRFRLFAAMDPGADSKNWGTIYFPISLAILANLCWGGLMPLWVGAIGVLAMGWGDGLASLVGEKFGGKGMLIWGRRKTAAGTTAMFAASFLIALAFTLGFNARVSGALPAGLLSAIGVSAVTAGAAALVELLTPFGLDNLTVPLLTSLLYLGAFA